MNDPDKKLISPVGACLLTVLMGVLGLYIGAFWAGEAGIIAGDVVLSIATMGGFIIKAINEK